MKKINRYVLLVLTAVITLSFTLSASAATRTATLRLGSRGDEVKQLQGNLIYLGYLNDIADGIFGWKTQAAVMKYQRANGLGADGIYGPQTRSRLTKEVLSVLAVVDTAKSLKGIPYVTAGTSPSTGFDCSGFTQYVYGKAGISLPRVSSQQATAGKWVSYAQMRPGDLVAFNSPVSHVGIYIGNGKFIHSPKPGDSVKITELKYMNLTAIRRVTGAVVN